MKVMMVARRYPPDIISGTETVFENLYRQACKAHDVRLVVGFTRDRSLVPAEALGVDLRGKRLGMSHVAMWRAARGEARRWRPDVVLANSIEVPVTGTPTACIVHDLNFGRAGRGLSARAREALYKWRCPKMDRIISVSEATRVALEQLGVEPSRIRVVHNGVDTERFHPVPREGSSSTAVIAYPGRILPGKGQHVAIDAVSRLSAEDKAKVELRIVGTVADPVYFEQLKVQAADQPVSFHTEVPAIEPYYQQADLILFPTLMIEGFGFTAAEGMACGKPVVWSEQAAIREATGGIGVAVPGGDVDAWRGAIVDFLADREGFAAMGEQGRAFVEARYSWAGVWQSYERALSEMAAR